RVRPRIVVEQLTLRPDRERRNKQQDRRQREQDPDKHSALLAHPRTTAQTSGLDVLKDLLFLSVELVLCEHAAVQRTLELGQLLHALVCRGSGHGIRRRHRFLLSLGHLASLVRSGWCPGNGSLARSRQTALI